MWRLHFIIYFKHTPLHLSYILNTPLYLRTEGITFLTHAPHHMSKARPLIGDSGSKKKKNIYIYIYIYIYISFAKPARTFHGPQPVARDPGEPHGKAKTETGRGVGVPTRDQRTRNQRTGGPGHQKIRDQRTKVTKGPGPGPTLPSCKSCFA